MADEVKTDLPKVKVKMPAKPKEKAAKAKTEKSETKVKAKADTKKSDKPAKAKTDGKKTVKSSKKDAKPAAKAKAPAKVASKGKAGPLTAETVAARISKIVASGKVETVKSVDYTSSSSVAEGLVAKAATILLRTYSDKAVSAIQHGDAKIAKAAKELLAKNAATIRADAVATHAKKMAGPIVRSAKAADAGKLSAADYRSVVFEV